MDVYLSSIVYLNSDWLVTLVYLFIYVHIHILSEQTFFFFFIINKIRFYNKNE
jgi:hypothetical protein